MATNQQQFCVRWNSYQSNLQNAFPKLLTSEHFVDVTLACESEMIKCHKVVLSACSTYFEKLLVQNPCQHPIIFMKDMRFAEMQALVDFMYKGEVNVTQDELPSLLRSADALQIRGLCGSDQLLSQHYLGNNLQQNAATPQLQQATVPPAEKVVALQSCPEQSVKKKTEDAPVAQSAEQTKVNSTASEVDKKEGVVAAATDSQENKTNEDNGSQDNSIKEEYYDTEESYYDNDAEMDTEYLEQDDDDPNQPGTSGLQHDVKSEFAIANVSCQYDSGGGTTINPVSRRIRRSEAELRRAAECITRGQTFQTVSDQFNIPISTIRFYMARKGILPRRKRGRACSATPGHSQGLGSLATTSYQHSPGNTSPIGPPYHIVHYKLPALGAKLK